METLTIQITNEKAYNLLKDLEDLHIIKVLKRHNQSIGKLSDRFAGKLDSAIAEDLHTFTEQIRNEWDKSSL